MRLLFFSIFLFIVAHKTSAQQFKSVEDSLTVLQNKLYAAKTDNERNELNTNFKSVFERVLKQPESFNFPFDSLKEIGRIYSPDKTFRIITWDVPHDDGTHDYFGFTQWYDAKHKKYCLFSLTDKSNEIKNPETTAGDAAKWFGMLYYKIIPVKANRKKYYTLLGFDLNDKLTSKKIIDVLYFNSDGSPHFGANLFKMEKTTPKRLVFEYSAQATMSLKYDEDSKQIVFDHLSPVDSKFEGQYQYYGPDFSFDAFQFKKGKWHYYSDVDARNRKSGKDVNYNDPKEKGKNYENKQLYKSRK